jgi:HlyD family secretion protein
MNKWLYIILGIIIITSYAGKKLFIVPQIENDRSLNQLSVTAVSPKYKTIFTSLKLVGTLVPKEKIVIATELSNIRVKEIYADVGDIVEKGQKLLLLDNKSLNNQFIQFKSEYERVRDEFDRIDKIKDTGAVSKELFIQKLKIMESAKAKFDDAKLNLERSLVTAMDKGIIYERKATLGALINSDEALYNIAYNNEIEMEAEVPETLISKVKVGQDVVIIVSGIEKTIPGKVRLIQLNIDNLNRTAKIRISFYSKTFLPVGLFADAEVITNTVNGLTLPTTTLQENEFGKYIWKINTSNKVRKIPIEIKLRDTTDFIIEDGIALEDKVINLSESFLKEDDCVNIIEVK